MKLGSVTKTCFCGSSLLMGSSENLTIEMDLSFTFVYLPAEKRNNSRLLP